jgi:choline dehydrogenase
VRGVGKNLQDHLLAVVGYEDKAGVAGNVAPLNLLWWLAQHSMTSGGPLASNVGEGGGFVRTTSGATIPDLQFHFLPVGSAQECFDKEAFAPKGRAFSIVPTLIYPKSRGEIRLTSKDPAKAPLIDPRYFSEPADLKLMVEGVKLGQSIARSKVLDRSRGKALTPLCDAEDDKTIEAEIRRRCNTIFHPVGTCKMGSDADAVVDEKLRVRGVTGLRVVDASIMPTIVGGNTNAPVIMIAEKAAAMIAEAR